MSKCIILANGKPPHKKLLLYLQKKGYEKLLCADGGANTAYKLKLMPDYIIGDLDSIYPETLKYYSTKTKVIKVKRQDDTDVEKCLKFVIKNRFTKCILLGVIGDRLDHSFANLGIVLKFSDKIAIKVISEKSILTVKTGYVKIKTIPNEIISMYAFNDKTLITTKGLRYQLQNDTLPFGIRESTSNVATGNEIELKINGGKIFLVRELNTVRANDLI